MKSQHINRLIMLANHLEKIKNPISDRTQEIVFLETNSQVFVEAQYYAWVFNDCPKLFPGWRYRNSAPVYYLADRDKGTVWSAMFFFGLISPRLFLHLFGADEGAQIPEIYGGKKYSHATPTGNEIAFNIKNYIIKYNYNEKR